MMSVNEVEKVYEFMKDRGEEDLFMYEALLKLRNLPWEEDNNMRLSYFPNKPKGISRMTYYRKLNKFQDEMREFLNGKEG